MAISRLSEASPTVGATEYSLPAASTTLATRTEIGFIAAVLDLNALAAGDEFLLQVYATARSSAGTKRLVDSWPLFGNTGKPNLLWPSPGGSILVGNGWDVTLKKIAGTDRAIPFTLWLVQ